MNIFKSLSFSMFILENYFWGGFADTEGFKPMTLVCEIPTSRKIFIHKEQRQP